jgi:hypothetical protein
MSEPSKEQKDRAQRLRDRIKKIESGEAPEKPSPRDFTDEAAEKAAEEAKKKAGP